MNKLKFACAWLLLSQAVVFSSPIRAQQAAKIKPAPAAAEEDSGAAANPGALSLDQVVDLALEHSPDLALARVRYNVAMNLAGVVID